MAQCNTCGNNYTQSFQVIMSGQSYDFDCFECAIHSLAPKCQHCGCKILGHGIQDNENYYCCAHCAHESGLKEAKDNIQN